MDQAGLEEDEGEEFQQSRHLRENRKNPPESAPAKAAPIIQNENLLKALDRTKTSSRNAMYILAPTLEALGIDINDEIFSHTTLEKYRKEMRNRVAAEIKASFKPPKRLVVHFDGKLLSELNGSFGDHLAVMISGNSEQCRQGKLLSAKIIKDGTGLTQAKEVVSSALDWNVAQFIVGMCFDTTSANTGKVLMMNRMSYA